MTENKTIRNGNPQPNVVQQVQKDPRTLCVEKGRILRRQIRASDGEAAMLFKEPRQTAQADPNLENKLDPPTAFSIQTLDPEDGEDIEITAKDFDPDTTWWADSYILINWAPTETTSHGKWKNLINVRNGEIVALDNASRALHKPALHWSDVVFIQWMNECQKHKDTTGQPASDLRYVFRYNITNPITHSVVAGILSKHGQSPEPWMECKVSPNSLDGKALLGTPNGVGVAYLLIQHKKEFGSKRVGSIDILTVSNDSDLGTLHDEQKSYALRFEIVEANPEGPVGPQQTGVKRNAMEEQHEEDTPTKKFRPKAG